MQQEVFGHDFLGCHVGDAGKRQDAMGFAVLEESRGELQGVGGEHVVIC